MPKTSVLYENVQSMFEKNGAIDPEQLPDLNDIPRNFILDGIYARTNGLRRLDYGSRELDRHLMEVIFERLAERPDPTEAMFKDADKKAVSFKYLIRPADSHLDGPFRTYLKRVRERVEGGELKRETVLGELFYSISQSRSDWALRAAIEELGVTRSELAALFFGSETHKSDRGNVSEYPFDQDEAVEAYRRQTMDRSSFLRKVQRVNNQRKRTSDIRFYRNFLQGVRWTDRQRAWIIEDICLKKYSPGINSTYKNKVDREFFKALGQLHDGRTFRPTDLPDGVELGMKRTNEALDYVEDCMESDTIPDYARGGLGSNYDVVRQLLTERNEERFEEWCERGSLRVWEFYHAAEVSLDDAGPLRIVTNHLDPGTDQLNKALRRYLKGVAGSHFERLANPEEGLQWLLEHGAELKQDYDGSKRAVDFFLQQVFENDNRHPSTYKQGVKLLKEAGAQPPSQAARSVYANLPYIARRKDRIDVVDPLIQHGIYPQENTLKTLMARNEQAARQLIERLPKRAADSVRQLVTK